jgi:hypothetical protein
MELMIKGLSKRGECGAEKGGLIFEGFCHYVIENKCRKNVSLRACHYIYENKRLILLLPLCV